MMNEMHELIHNLLDSDMVEVVKHNKKIQIKITRKGKKANELLATLIVSEYYKDKDGVVRKREE